MTVVPGNVSNGSFVNTDLIAVTPLIGNATSFYVIRHANYSTLSSTRYRLNVPTSQGLLSIPQLSADLTLNGRDSKIYVTDYELGCSVHLLYSTADVFTWKKYETMNILILYNGLHEVNEVAFTGATTFMMLDGSGIRSQIRNGSLVLNWASNPFQKVVLIGNDLTVYLLGKNYLNTIETLRLDKILQCHCRSGPSADSYFTCRSKRRLQLLGSVLTESFPGG